MTIGRGLNRLWRNEFTAFLTQTRSQDAFFDEEIHGRPPGTPFTPQEQAHFDKWHLPELGFRNYWYPALLSRELTSRPVKRRMLGETIALWRDGGKPYAIANRCPHRGASLSEGHVRFPGSGTLTCPYHGWTFDGATGCLRACIQEGPDSAMVRKGVKTKAYPVEERVGVVWVWIGDMDPVPVVEDLPVAMKQPGATSFVHFTPIWRTSWAPLIDNFSDGLHAPYLHRASPQYLFNRLPIRAMGEEPHYEYVEHEGKILEELRRPLKGRSSIDQVEFPGLGVYPRRKWFRVRPPRRKPGENYIPGYEPRSFIHGLPAWVSTVHEENYFTLYVTPVDRDHVFSLCALSGKMPPRERRWWAFYFRVWALTHNTVFIGQDHRVLRHTELGPERLSAWDRDVVTWRRFSVQHARGYRAESATDGGSELGDAADGTASGHTPEAADSQGTDGRDAARAPATEAAIP